ncbi:hypothetical protein [Aestuariivirga sp.]|uniref:hypothetical protein n=1 Tax=Aestuariivirga sp. TaxID=2650926 RepID=UPI0035938647
MAATAVIALAVCPSNAADIVDVPADLNDWTFTAAAYLWASGLSGDSGVFGLPPQEVDLSFADILEDLNFAFMGFGEARKGRFSLGADLTYADVEANVSTPFGIIADDIDVTTSTFMGTAYVGYSVVDSADVRIDGIAGARLWSVNTEFDVNGGALNGRSASDGATWVDPMAGLKLYAELSPEIYISAWGMIGGFGVSSDMMWDVMGGLGYRFTDSFSLFGGYRAVSVDYSNDGFVYDMVQQGPVFAGVFRF